MIKKDYALIADILLGACEDSKDSKPMRKLIEIEASKEYDALLDQGPLIKIGGLKYLRSTVLKRVDPLAYREGLLNWADSEGIEIG